MLIVTVVRQMVIGCSKYVGGYWGKTDGNRVFYVY